MLRSGASDIHVLILGGGVAGMTAAHELIDRGFQVTLLEAKNIPGGKSRSFSVPGTGIGGRKDLPAEHGFRFFPGFYDHVIDSMKRIPVGQRGRTARDNLVEASRLGIARFDGTNFQMVTRLPRSLNDLQAIFRAWINNSMQLTKDEADFFAERVWQVLTSSKERSSEEYEKISWWEFIKADCFSDNYRKILAEGLTKTLVASKPRVANAKTIGQIGVQMLFETERIGGSISRLLNGPTNSVWIDPWHQFLVQAGVDFRLEHTVTSLVLRGNRIEEVTYSKPDGQSARITPNFVISSLPVEVFAQLVSPKMLACDSSLSNIQKLRKHVDWMNGIMFYFDIPVPVLHGHMMYIDSPWALTSVSQTQFWSNIKFSQQYGDGKIKGLMSVNISDWDQPGIIYDKPARKCTKDEVIDEVWGQLKKSLNFGENILLTDENLISVYIDPAITFAQDGGSRVNNTEPLFVNLVDSWHLRPDVRTRIKNLLLASDYVRTETDLATMEAANEAARRAVNCLIDLSGVRARRCRLWKMYEPWFVWPFRLYDRWRYRRGLPWANRLPWVVRFSGQILITTATAISRVKIATQRLIS